MTNPVSDRYFVERPYLDAALITWTRSIEKLARNVDRGAAVSGRVKTHRSVLGKVYKNAAAPRVWESLGDLVALKAIFPTKRAASRFTDLLEAQSSWNPFLDRRVSAPNELRYESSQFDLTDPGVVDSSNTPIKVEVQVRTAASDAWYMVDHRVRYKGPIELTSDLERRMLRLIVLAELFDSEVDFMLNELADRPESESARVYDDLTSMLDGVIDGHSRATRPPGLFEMLLNSYQDHERSHLIDLVRTFVEANTEAIAEAIRRHAYGSDDFVESRDWLYLEPEALLVAERASTKPAKLSATIQGSDFESLLESMRNQFGTIAAASSN